MLLENWASCFFAEDSTPRSRPKVSSSVVSCTVRACPVKTQQLDDAEGYAEPRTRRRLGMFTRPVAFFLPEGRRLSGTYLFFHLGGRPVTRTTPSMACIVTFVLLTTKVSVVCLKSCTNGTESDATHCKLPVVASVCV
jgi:hypothetical protein